MSVSVRALRSVSGRSRITAATTGVTVVPVAATVLVTPESTQTINHKGQENPEFCEFGAFGSFPYNPANGSGTSGNGPVGPEISSFIAREELANSKIHLFVLYVSARPLL